MKRGRIAFIMAIVLISSIVCTSLMLIMPIYAAGPGEQIEIVPAAEVDSSIQLTSEKIPVGNYVFDTKKFKFTEFMGATFKALTDFLFFINLWLSKLTNWVMIQGFTLDIFKYINNILDDIVHAVRDSVYTPLLTTVLCLAGAGVIFYAVVNKIGTSISILVSTVVVLFLAAAFMNSPTVVIGMVNDVSGSISQSVLSGTATVVQGKKISSSDAVVNLSNIYWETAVIKPWEIIEFGAIQKGDAAQRLLADAPETTQRINLARQYENLTLFKASGQTIRLAMALFIVLINIIMSAMIIVLSFFMFAAQFGAVIASIVVIGGFLVALLPNMGLRVAIRGIYNVFEFLFTKLGITLLFVTYFAISSALYGSIGEAGWFGIMILQLCLIVTIIIYRDKIFGFVNAIKDGQGAAISNMNRQPKNDLFPTALRAYGYAKMGQDLKGMWDRRQDRKLDEKYQPLAEEYLYQQYRTNPGVRARADQRVGQGFKAFSVDEIESTTQMMKKLHRQGENPERLLMTSPVGKTDEQIRQEQRAMERGNRETKARIEREEDKNQNTLERAVKGDRESKFYDGSAAFVARMRTQRSNGEAPDRTYWQSDTANRAETGSVREEAAATGTTGQVETEAPAPIRQTESKGSAPAVATDQIISKPADSTIHAGGEAKIQRAAVEHTTNTASKEPMVFSGNVPGNWQPISEAFSIDRGKEQLESKDETTSITRESVGHQEQTVNRVENVIDLQRNQVDQNVRVTQNRTAETTNEVHTKQGSATNNQEKINNVEHRDTSNINRTTGIAHENVGHQEQTVKRVENVIDLQKNQVDQNVRVTQNRTAETTNEIHTKEERATNNQEKINNVEHRNTSNINGTTIEKNKTVKENVAQINEKQTVENRLTEVKETINNVENKTVKDERRIEAKVFESTNEKVEITDTRNEKNALSTDEPGPAALESRRNRKELLDKLNVRNTQKSKE